MATERSLAILSGVVIAAAFAFGGYKVAAGVTASKNAQAVALENLRTWKSAYEALLPVKVEWERTYAAGMQQQSQDLVAIGQSLRLGEAGLDFDLNSLRGEKIEPVSFDGVSVGLNRICVAGGSTSGLGLGVSAPTMSDLVNGIQKLQRKDIELVSIDVTSAAESPKATLGGLCVLVRSDDSGF